MNTAEIIHVIFVCRANSFRSPLADAVAKKAAKDLGVSGRFNFSSAGLEPAINDFDKIRSREALLDPTDLLDPARVEHFQLMENMERAYQFRDPATSTLRSLGITTYTRRTPRELTPELLIENGKNGRVFCFTKRQVSELEILAKHAKNIYPEADQPKLDLLTDFAGLKGGVTDPENLIATNEEGMVLNLKTAMKCLHEGEHGLAVRVLVDSLKGRNPVDGIYYKQAERIQRCVRLAIPKMLAESERSTVPFSKSNLIAQTV